MLSFGTGTSRGRKMLRLWSTTMGASCDPPEHSLWSKSVRYVLKADFFLRTLQMALAVAPGFFVTKYVSLGNLVRENSVTIWVGSHNACGELGSLVSSTLVANFSSVFPIVEWKVDATQSWSPCWDVRFILIPFWWTDASGAMPTFFWSKA